MVYASTRHAQHSVGRLPSSLPPDDQLAQVGRDGPVPTSTGSWRALQASTVSSQVSIVRGCLPRFPERDIMRWPALGPVGKETRRESCSP